MNICKSALLTIAVLSLLILPNTGNTAEFKLELVGSWPVGECKAVASVGDYVYFSSGKYIRLVDFTNPASPVEMGHVEVSENINEIYIDGRFAFVTCGPNGLYIVDFFDFTKPVVIGHVDTHDAVDVTVWGMYAYVADRAAGIRIVNIANVANPYIAAEYQSNGDPVSVAIGDNNKNYLFIAEAAAQKGVRSLNVTNPTNPVEAGFYQINNGATAIRVYSQNAYVLSNGMRTFDISNPSYIEQKGSAGLSATNKIAVNNGYVFAAELTNGLIIYNATNIRSPQDIKTITEAVGSGINVDIIAYDVAINGNRAYIANGSNGLLVLNIETKTAPFPIGNFNAYGNLTSVSVSNKIMYVTDSTYGLRIFNVNNPVSPVQIGQVAIPLVNDVELMSGTPYAFVSSLNLGTGVQGIDISDPTNPIKSGNYSLYESWNLSVGNGYVYSAAGNNGMVVIDVSTNPSFPTATGGLKTITQVQGIAYDRDYVILAAGDNGLSVLDVYSSTTPIVSGSLKLTGNAINVTSDYPYAYVATEDAGMRIIDWVAPGTPKEIGFYDPQVPIYDVVKNGLYAYLAADDLYIVNVSNPENPYMADSFEIGGARGVAVEGDYVYVAAGTNGVYIFKVTAPAPPSNVVLNDVPDDQGNKLEITWSLSADDDSIIQYNIYRSKNPTPTEPVAIGSFGSVDEFIETEKTTTILIASVARGTTYYLDEFFPVRGEQYYYWVGAVADYGESEKIAASIITAVDEKPSEFKVSTPFPNPFNPMTSIQYELPEASYVKLVIYDSLGRKVTVLQDGYMNAGVHKTVWNARNSKGIHVGSGVYLYQLSAGNYFNQGKVMFLR
ncbi:MAG: T9SS type A sorting domain-containing protein [Candidatus Latescibacteria bacterium]|nr:T9SS type A sorting domain-containing protein [Candidatus Latescibacterota bacterium]